MSGHHHHHSVDDDSEQKTRVVVVITLVTMIVEIYAGIVTKSMGLLADGWHMGTHAAALGITLYAYYYARTEDLVKGKREINQIKKIAKVNPLIPPTIDPRRLFIQVLC